MFRNKEFQRLVLMMGIIGLVATIVGFIISNLTGLIILITSVLLILCSYFFTIWRYAEIEKLASYLREISSGNYSLDVRDNVEGELSILKNEIYKVTNMLSEHRSLLEKDKTHLTIAISDISHQIKTPLTSMMVMADLISDSKLPTEKRIEFTNNIQIQLERLDWLVSSLLKLSKIDAGTVHFKQDLVNVKEIVESTLDSVQIPLEMKEQRVLVKGDDQVSFIGDYHWTKEALINILKNCIEHTPQNGQLEISFCQNPLYTDIHICDQGKGIPKEDLPYIFTRFYKGKYASEESVGIGLAMAHRIITSQNGDIEVKSEMGKGSQFTIKFYHQIV